MREPTPLPTRFQGRGANLRPLVERRGGQHGVDRFKDVDPAKWMAAIMACLERGTGLLVSITSDGGAVSLTLYEGDTRARSYASSADELEELLDVIRNRGG